MRRRDPVAPGQESVWDYPRPPRLERTPRRIRVVVAGETVVDSVNAWRVLETSHPPGYYIPPGDIRAGVLAPGAGASFCEWKGQARYWTLEVGDTRIENVGWSYPAPTPAFAPIADHVAFYAGPMDACYVDDERVTPQPGGFYGGWITSDIVGPFKGAPGTWGW
jgi:uncharacterized protein (DUF427 family)